MINLFHSKQFQTKHFYDIFLNFLYIYFTFRGLNLIFQDLYIWLSLKSSRMFRFEKFRSVYVSLKVQECFYLKSSKRVYVSCLDYNFRMKINLSRQKIGILLGENITHEKILGENIHINVTVAILY